MSASEKQNIAAWVNDRLEAYVDGDLPAEERRRIEELAGSDEATARRLRLALDVKAGLRSIWTPACPPEVTAAVLAEARESGTKASRVSADRASVQHASSAERVAQRRRAGAAARDRGAAQRAGTRRLWTNVVGPSLAFALFALLVTASALIGRHSTPAVVDGAAEIAAAEMTAAEVDQALQDVRWTLAFVSKVGRRTGQAIRQEVLEERVTHPVQRAVGEAFRTEPTS